MGEIATVINCLGVGTNSAVCGPTVIAQGVGSSNIDLEFDAIYFRANCTNESRIISQTLQESSSADIGHWSCRVTWDTHYVCAIRPILPWQIQMSEDSL